MGPKPQGARVCKKAAIVDEIVSKLRPWKRPSKSLSISAMDGSADSKNQTLAFREMPVRPNFVRATVEKEIHELLEQIVQGWQPAIEVRKTACKLEKLLDRFIHTLDRIPPSSTFLMASHHDLPQRLRDFRKFVALMDGMIPSKKTDLVKRCCATTGFRIVIMLSSKLPTGNVDGPMFTIASLLYEIATGIAGQNLKRACDTCLREMRARSGTQKSLKFAR